MAGGNGELEAVQEALKVLKQDKRPLDMKEAKRIELRFSVQQFLKAGGNKEEIPEATRILGI